MSSRKKQFARSSSIDEQFDAFLKASIGSDSDTSLSKYVQPKAKKEKPWWQSSVETSEDFDTQLGSTGGFGGSKSFLKKKEKKAVIPPIVRKTPEATAPAKVAVDEPGKLKESSTKYDGSTEPFSARMSGAEPTQRTSRLLTETEEFRESQLSFDQSTETAQDTLAEAADKSQFFKKLAADAEGTLDFSKLNQELGVTGNASFLEKMEQTVPTVTVEQEESDHEQHAAKDELEEGRPATYLGDAPPAGDEPNLPSRPNLLANVSLNDTMDTSLQATSAIAADQSGGMGNTSQLDFEAVQEAYQEVHDKEGTTHTLPFANTASGPKHEDEMEEKEQVPVWQNNSKGESQTTSVWELQPAENEVKDEGNALVRQSPATSSATPPPSRHVESPQREQASVWDLEPVSQAETPGQPSSTHSDGGQRTDDIDWGGGRFTPPTAVGYQTIDQLTPIEQEFTSQTRDSQTNTPSRRSSKKLMGKTQTLRRPSSATKKSTDKFSHVKSSGYGVVHPTPTRNRSASPKARSPKKTGKKKSPTTNQKLVREERECLLPTSSSPVKVLQSVESFASYLRDQFISSTPAYKESMAFQPVVQEPSHVSVDREAALLNEIREWQQKWREECRMREKVNADFMSAQKYWDRQAEDTRLRHEQETGRLRQQTYILEAKLQASVGSHVGDTFQQEGNDGTVKQTISRLESEIQSQEKLISGYQLENEKLYKEMKQMDSLHKSTYERLYQENHKQASELAQLRERISQREAELRIRGVHPITTALPLNDPIVNDKTADTPMTAALGAGRIADLKSQLVNAKNDSGSLAAQVTVLTKKNTDLSCQLELLVEERDKLKVQLLASKQPSEVKVMQERYQHEINVLEKRVRWYMDNQRILDTDLERLRQKDCEINTLNNKIKQLEDQKCRTYDGAQRSKDRAADARRIKDLERQVKEMEQIVRRRNPNSVQSLIWTASLTPDTATSKPPSTQFLEDQVVKLEQELAEKDGDTSRLLRAMEQQCNQSKLLYEKRIKELEMKEGGNSTNSRHTTVTALEREIESMKEHHRKKQAEMQATNDELKEEINKLKHKCAVELKSETRALRLSREQTDSFKSQLEGQLKVKLAEIAELHETVERLQKEKKQVLVELSHVQSVQRERDVPGARSPRRSQSRTIGAPRDEVQRFPAESLPDLLEVNRQLAGKYQQVQVEISQLRVDHQRELAKLEGHMREEQTDLISQMEEKEREHGKELEQLKRKYAIRQSDSDVSKYKNEINSLQTVIKHLKEDRLRAQHDTEELSALRIRNVTLESRIRALEEKVEDAREHHTPEMRQFERLKDKISKMEERFSLREEELKRVINQNKVTYQEDLRMEVVKWKNIVKQKNVDIERFRSELDSILTILKELRRQGVTIPIG